jgi:hypothetical protein
MRIYNKLTKLLRYLMKCGNFQDESQFKSITTDRCNLFYKTLKRDIFVSQFLKIRIILFI